MSYKHLSPLLLSLMLAACASGQAPQAQEEFLSPVSIDKAQYAAQTRLPCENGSGEFCHLRTYQVMVESFVNGDPSIGYATGYGTSHHMGDLRGIINSLDYISNLGVNALWLTPVFNSEGGNKIDATGYFAKDYFTIDPNFGDLATAKELVQKAHEKGLYVFFDGVFGHHKGTVKPSPSGLRASNGKAQGNVGRQAIYPDDLAFYQEVASYWTEELCLDGWRLDQAYQVPLDAWAKINATVQASSKANAQNPQCQVNQQQWGTLGYMVGEVWDSNRKIVSTAYGGVAGKPKALPSAFDFPRRYALVQSLAVEESGHGQQGLNELMADWHSHRFLPEHAQPNLMLGNHDLVRFGDLIQRGGLDNYWQRHKAAFSYLAAYSGPITLYYGEEIGDEVPNYARQINNNCASRGLCDDHVSRTSGKIANVTAGFTPSAEQQDLMDYLKSLMLVRKNNPALYEGSVQTLYVDSSLLVVSKETSSQQIVYFLNSATTDRTSNLSTSLVGNSSQLTDLISGEVITANGDSFEVTVSELSGRLLLVN